MSARPPLGPASSDRRTLDPADWDQFRAVSHAALDDMISFMTAAGEGPVWQPAPDAIRQRFRAPIPHAGTDLANVLDDFHTDIKPYVTGNAHPLFMGWVHGAGNPAGMIGEMLAAGLNANCGFGSAAACTVSIETARRDSISNGPGYRSCRFCDP